MKSDNKEKPQKPPKKVKPPGADGHRQRMLKRLLHSPAHLITERELVEILLYYSVRVRDTRDTAVYLMERFDNDLRRLLSASPKELMTVNGVGPRSAELIGVINKTVELLENLSKVEEKTYANIEDIGALFSEHHNGSHHDSFWLALFDNSMHLLDIKKLRDDSMSVDDDNIIFSIVAGLSKTYCSSFAVARLPGDLSCYPTSGDFEMLKRVLDVSEITNMVFREYFIASPDENIGIKDLYI